MSLKVTEQTALEPLFLKVSAICAPPFHWLETDDDALTEVDDELLLPPLLDEPELEEEPELLEELLLEELLLDDEPPLQLTPLFRDFRWA